MKVSTYTGLDTLPPAYEPLWDGARVDLFASRTWTEAYLAESLEPGEKLRLYAVESVASAAPGPLGLAVGLTSRIYSAHVRARALRFYQPDAAPYAPAVATTEEPAAIMAAVMDHVCTADPPFDVIRLSPAERPSGMFDLVVQRLRHARYIVQPYFMFANRFEITEGMTPEDYLEQRPSRLRNTLRRRSRKLEALAGGRVELITDEARLDEAIPHYESVFAASWKHAELLVPVSYIHEIMRRAARVNALRLGILYIDDDPAAAQFWLVNSGVGVCYRLAFKERYRDRSVGTILTWRIIRHLLEADGVRALDFGVGDDPYKKDWMRERRERWGIAAFNPRTWRGIQGAVRHVGLQPVKRSLRWAWRLVRPYLRHGQAGGN
jgi:hypothetical protein